MRHPAAFARTVLSRIPAVVWERDVESLGFTYVNDAAAHLLGFPVAAWTAAPDFLAMRLHPDDRDEVLGRLRAGLGAGGNLDLEYRLTARDAREVWVRDIGGLSVSSGRAVRAYGLLVDVTEEHLARAALQAREHRLSVQSAALGALARDPLLHEGPFDDALSRILRVDAEALECARIGYWAMTDDGARIRCVQLYDSVNQQFRCNGHLTTADYPAYFRAVACDRVVGVDDTLTDPRTHELVERYLRPLGITSMLDAPVRVGGTVVGILCHEHTGALRAWTSEEMQFAGSMGDLVALALEAEERRRAEAGQCLADTRFRLAFEGAPDPILLLDTSGRVLDINAGAEVALRLPRAQATGQPVGRFLEPLEDELAADVSPARRAEVRRADGTRYPAELRFRRIPGADEPIVILMLRDITVGVAVEKELAQHRQHLQELVDARTEELRAANRELESFSYSVSHDLRAPLRAIDGFARLLSDAEEDRLSAESQHHLRRIRDAARRMSCLIDDLLRLSRVGRTDVRRVQVDVTALARAVGEELQRAAPDRDVRLHVAEGLVADADPALLRIVMENLLGNAWKFTSRRATAHVEVGSTAGEYGEAFFVRDDGVGFENAYASSLFTAFSRLHGADEFEGTGIGLAIVRRAVERHGGRVWAEGEVERGASFYFTIPPDLG